MSKRKAKRRIVAVKDVTNIYDDKMTDCNNQGMGYNNVIGENLNGSK